MSEDRSVTIHLGGLECFGRHGVLPAERDLGQRFVVDLALHLDRCDGVDTDALADTVDYGALAAAVAKIVEGPPVALLERLAERIARRALEEPGATAVEVAVRKPHVALEQRVAEMAVSLRRERGRGS